MMMNILRNEVKRAMDNGSSQKEKMDGLSTIKERYLSNGYPPHIINRAINHRRKPSEPQEQQQRQFLTLPFLSEKQVQEVRNSLRRCNLSNFLSISFKSATLSSILRPKYFNTCKFVNCKYCLQADRGESCMTKFVVYIVKCVLCSSFYVGESARTVRSRLREHVSVGSSHVFQHLLSHSARPCLESIHWSILHSGLRHTDTRLAVEINEIRSRRPDLNVQNTNHL